MDREAHKSRALAIAGNSSARSLMTAQLRDLGLGEVRACAKLREARLLLEQGDYDIVLCDDDADSEGGSASELLDELRREQLLPYGTVFILVTAAATYSRIAEAAEGGLDSILVRPYAASALGERLAEARRRKRTLQPIFDAAAAGRREDASALALQRYRNGQPYGLFCARIAAEWMLRAQQADAAQAVYKEVMTRAPQPWAELGLARARLAAADLGGARRLVEALVQRGSAGADADELLGRILVEQGDFAPALEALRRAVAQTPHCLLRLQQAGTLAFYLGQHDDARQWLDRCIAYGVQSTLFDGLSLLLLALLRHDQRDAKGVALLAGHLRTASAGRPDSARLARLRDAGAALHKSSIGDRAGAVAAAQPVLLAPDADDGDLESALVALWLTPRVGLLQGAERAEAVHRWALRYGTSRASTEGLAAAVQTDAAAAERVRQAHAEIQSLAEQALQHSLRGAPLQAAERLATDGERTRNAKLIEMGLQVLRRQPSQDAEAAALAERLAQAQKRWCRVAAPIAGMLRSGRTPGGLALRV